MNAIQATIKRKQASHTVLIYALAAGAVSAIAAVDPEPISGTALVVFADTPIVTALTIAMIIHLAIIYNQKDVLADCFILIAALSAGLVFGALGAKILGRIVPVLGTMNNAIISFTLHYATGHVIIDYLEEERKLSDLTLDYVKDKKKEYEDEGEARGKAAYNVSKKMNSADKKLLKDLTEQYREVAKKLKKATDKNLTGETIRQSDKLLGIGEKIGQIYAKYGFSID